MYNKKVFLFNYKVKKKKKKLLCFKVTYFIYLCIQYGGLKKMDIA
jgi:hypothetical protein